MKKFELIFTGLQVPIDYLAIILAGFTAYILRFTSFVKDIRPILFDLPWSQYWPIVLLVAATWIIIFVLSGLYRTYPQRKMIHDIPKVVFACSTGFAGIAIYIFFTLQKFDSRFLVLIGWLLAILYVIIGRLLIFGLRRIFYHFEIGLRRTVIIGNESIAQIISEELKNKHYAGFKLVGSFDEFNNQIKKSILDKKPNEIIFTNPKGNEKSALQAVEFANEHHISFKYSADLFATISSNIEVLTIAGIPIIELNRTRLSGWGRIFKRTTDIIFSIFLIIIFSPIYLISSIILLIETGRPIFYKNERIGQGGKKFAVYKFRSMYKKDCTGDQFGKSGENALETEQNLIATQSKKKGPLYKIENDPRVTPFGKFIRKWSIDELPQFINVLKGEMSLVGPRPHQEREVSKYKTSHKIVLAIKPGITGMAQISGRSNLSFDDEVKLDAFYIENWNILLDFIILIKTPFTVIKGKGAW